MVLEIDRHGAGRMRQVPDHQCAHLVRQPRRRGEVVHAAGPIVDVRQHEHGGALVQLRRQVVGIDEPELEAVRACQRIDDVEVARKVGALGHNAPAVWRVKASYCNQLAFAGTDQSADFVSDTLRERDPACGIPAANQVTPPFLLNDVLKATERPPRKRTE
jgi:hypothetical protein